MSDAEAVLRSREAHLALHMCCRDSISQVFIFEASALVMKSARLLGGCSNMTGGNGRPARRKGDKIHSVISGIPRDMIQNGITLQHIQPAEENTDPQLFSFSVTPTCSPQKTTIGSSAFASSSETPMPNGDNFVSESIAAAPVPGTQEDGQSILFGTHSIVERQDMPVSELPAPFSVDTSLHTNPEPYSHMTMISSQDAWDLSSFLDSLSFPQNSTWSPTSTDQSSLLPAGTDYVLPLPPGGHLLQPAPAEHNAPNESAMYMAGVYPENLNATSRPLVNATLPSQNILSYSGHQSYELEGCRPFRDIQSQAPPPFPPIQIPNEPFHSNYTSVSGPRSAPPGPGPELNFHPYGRRPLRRSLVNGNIHVETNPVGINRGFYIDHHESFSFPGELHLETSQSHNTGPGITFEQYPTVHDYHDHYPHNPHYG